MQTTFLVVNLLFSSLALAEIRDRTIIGGHKDELSSVDRQRVKPCGQTCTYRLCNFNGEESFFLPAASFSIFNAPRLATIPYICIEGDEVGLVLRTGEARVAQGRKMVAISAWKPRGLKKKFKANFVQTYKVPFAPRSGIGRISSSVNQWSFLHDRCMTLPIRRYQRIDKDTAALLKIINVSKATDCVAFRTTAPAIQIMLLWDTSDDFDLEVTEPDGDVLTFRNRVTEAGKLNGDNNVGKCDTDLLGGREQVLYFPGGPIESGRYQIRIIHFKKCRDRPSNYQLRIVINGVQKTFKQGLTSVGGMKVIGRAAFNWP